MVENVGEEAVWGEGQQLIVGDWDGLLLSFADWVDLVDPV